MRASLYGLMLLSSVAANAQVAPPDSAVLGALSSHQYSIENTGRDFLIQEAKKSDFFLLGELHGDQEIPLLLHTLWPEMWKSGYRHIAAEVSPWAADQLEDVPEGRGPVIQGTWTKREAADVDAVAGPHAHVLWGCDMEELQIPALIQALAALNPSDSNLRRMVTLTAHGYDRKMASELLRLADGITGAKDSMLRQNLLVTLEIEKDRFTPETRMAAQNERERLMKRRFVSYLDRSTHPGKVLLRFGRNHLHRGYDARGISTLGNFVSELAVARRLVAFNVGVFGAGGTESLLGQTFDADERKDELAFALLVDRAEFPATVYDLRPIRPLLHRIPRDQRSLLETNLIYWADSYDALIVYKTVTPRQLDR